MFYAAAKFSSTVSAEQLLQAVDMLQSIHVKRQEFSLTPRPVKNKAAPGNEDTN